ncbi:MAG: DUF5808 domain-containing protein [Bacteroidia bacterium]
MNSKILLTEIWNSGWFQVISITVLALVFIQIVSRLTTKKNPEEQAKLDEWHDDPANYRAGIFYYNPKDKRWFPPKRIAAMGWTINFSNPIAVSILAAFFIIIFLMIFLTS